MAYNKQQFNSKNCEEDEYILKQSYREQPTVKRCTDASIEWTSELLRESPGKYLSPEFHRYQGNRY